MGYDLMMNISSGDLSIEDGQVRMVDGAERIAQQILISLRFWLGEWFLDTSQGVPYLEYILVKNPNERHIQQILTEEILAVAGVQSVTDMTLDFDRPNRRLIVSYEAATKYGLIARREALGYGR
nr:MAG TPA: Protein of unknown function (DUF2634) [Caudoviricetes sp.]